MMVKVSPHGHRHRHRNAARRREHRQAEYPADRPWAGAPGYAHDMGFPGGRDDSAPRGAPERFSHDRPARTRPGESPPGSADVPATGRQSRHRRGASQPRAPGRTGAAGPDRRDTPAEGFATRGPHPPVPPPTGRPRGTVTAGYRSRETADPDKHSPARGTAERDSAGRRSPIRGYPPMPGQPDPVYPPGQFSSWNRSSARAVWLGIRRAGETPETDSEPGYSVLAVSDPSADATSTQTWAAIDDTGVSRSRPPERRATGPIAVGATGELANGPGRQAAPPGPWSGDAGPVAGEAADRSQRGAGEGGAGHAGAGDHGEPPPGPAARTGHSRHGDRAGGRGKAAKAASQGKGAPGSGHTKRGKRSSRLLAGLLVLPVVIVGVVVAGYVYLSSSRETAAGRTAVPTQPVVIPSSPAASLGPWKYIVSRHSDPQPLTLAELFPQRFSANGTAGTRTVERASTHCPSAVIGSKLRSAVRKADCTQVMRASYLSTNRKLMATIGVLNLSTATHASRAGKASGSSEFIDQLPAAHGPTRKLKKGVGIEEAIVKGHYLILIVAEFADLHSPSGHARRTELERFETGLFNGTVNVSLTSRMVTGKPHTP